MSFLLGSAVQAKANRRPKLRPQEKIDLTARLLRRCWGELTTTRYLYYAQGKSNEGLGDSREYCRPAGSLWELQTMAAMRMANSSAFLRAWLLIVNTLDADIELAKMLTTTVMKGHFIRARSAHLAEFSGIRAGSEYVQT